MQQYNDLFRGGDANLTISNATLHSYANYTSLSMTLLNNGNSNVTVMAVLIYGNGTPSEMSNAIIVNGTAIVNESDIRNEQRGAERLLRTAKCPWDLVWMLRPGCSSTTARISR